MQSHRMAIPAVKPFANANIYKQYAIQEARWITHSSVSSTEDCFMRFSLPFSLDTATTFTIHVSADQRFELKCDKTYIGMGPDRNDIEHWSFHSYEITLDAGLHLFEVEVYYITTATAAAQVTRYPAFIFAAEGIGLPELRSGYAPWKVSEIESIRCHQPQAKLGYIDVGPEFTIAVEDISQQKEVDPVCYAEPYGNCNYGLMVDAWRLFPSRLNEQIRVSTSGVGCIRSVMNNADVALVETIDESWSGLLKGKPIEIAAHTTVSVLWDLENYYSAYPEIGVSAGKGCLIEVKWAESCYTEQTATSSKGNRSEIKNKYFIGFGDTFKLNGDDTTFTTPWWRAGRYVRVVIKTLDSALIIKRLGVSETRYPCEGQSSFACEDEGLQDIQALAVRGIQMCSHETYMDCPYYEQMMYVGDTRLQMLTHYTMEHRPELNLRGIEIFDWSRHVNNFVLERHPSSRRQLSTTFSMIWILMLRDQAWWQDEPGFIKDRIPGLRSQIEEFRSLAGENTLFTNLPGWSFIDWVNDRWEVGYAPDGEFGTSSINNLLFLLALQSAIDIEEHFGDCHFAQNYRDWSAKLASAIKDKFWVESKCLFADDLKHEYYSEHAQCLAILSGCFEELEILCFESLIKAEDLARTTVYFSFYLFETYKKMERVELLIEKFNFWKDLINQGFKTPVESPEPSRSDCHAWGSHPLFHMHASIMGVRPSKPGFKTVEIAPQIGDYTNISAKTPHPLGWIKSSIKKESDAWAVSLVLPKGVSGIFKWKGTEYELKGGIQEFSVN